MHRAPCRLQPASPLAFRITERSKAEPLLTRKHPLHFSSASCDQKASSQPIRREAEGCRPGHPSRSDLSAFRFARRQLKTSSVFHNRTKPGCSNASSHTGRGVPPLSQEAPPPSADEFSTGQSRFPMRRAEVVPSPSETDRSALAQLDVQRQFRGARVFSLWRAPWEE